MSILERLAEILEPSDLLTEASDTAPYLTDWRKLYRGQALAVVRPRDTGQVSRIVALASEAGISIVPQGGNTGLAGAGVPPSNGNNLVLSLERMNKIRSIDPANYTITVEAGCVLQQVQEAAAKADRLFPLSLSAEGSCRIGGNLSTNAGGIAVLRYGNMRDLALGLEVVLPDGRIWNGLRALRKDNTGYDLKQLFIGAEGTLGVITAAVLKLFPRPRERACAFVAVPSLEATLELLGRLRAASGDSLTSFELIPRVALEMAIAHVPGSFDPFPDPHEAYLLIEMTSSRENSGVTTIAEEALTAAMEAGLITEATIAQNEAQAKALWFLREAIVEAQKAPGACIKHDVAVPVAAVPAFLKEARQAAEAAQPGVLVYAFGHLGDGNIHFNLMQPKGMKPEDFTAQTHRLNRVVHDIVARYHGSISAEHGLGQLRNEEVRRYKPAIEFELMQKIKAALDPKGIMNPGKVL
ncbi:MAG TPA: FAD-binding oxidoreductase [Hypericibacter adhaerens]|uniref:D-2-hydroxyacid dehydrogenase n=1 Tax=Hypericibacter adhaerens TaxID=2602016 RepID=A0A5J6MXC3_9PROT|nr:FAD-binding oxidoreductase [Hypericibacter adhaerens]QEX21757.1 D-2-hydroxyacid dehydrogenase [Hypericibacter adhaerens]HWA42440.1 FAD-binding oxidoreductase [Hypericibacter adhaerens]